MTKVTKDTQHEEYEFLEETTVPDNVLFGHKEIAQTLADIVAKCPTPFTVGLFGKWGSGKSTIVNELKKEVSSNVVVVVFDVWKYEEDALRRAFLIELNKQLKPHLEKYSLEERLNKSITQDANVNPEINWKAVQIIAWLYLPLLAIPYFIKPLNQFTWASQVSLVVAFIVLLISKLVTQIPSLLISKVTRVTSNRFEDPHEFEKEFLRMIGSLKNTVDRVLIVFDNLDRVHDDKVHEVLLTIKTFLDPDAQEFGQKKLKAIYLIPCDDVAIKKHLDSHYHKKNKDTQDTDSDSEPDKTGLGSEFLRKIFNTSIRLPDFIYSELQTYTFILLKKTKISLFDSEKIAWLISKSFRDNPRQIVQFINTLLANYLLISRREKDTKDFEEGFLEKHILQFVKFFIMREFFPNAFEDLGRQKLWKTQGTDSYKELLIKHPDLKIIQEATSEIPMDQLKYLLTLRKSEAEKAIPGIEEVLIYIRTGQAPEAIRAFDLLYNSIKRDTKIKVLNDLFRSELESIVDNSNLGKAINVIFALAKDFDLKLDLLFYDEISAKLSSESMLQIESQYFNKYLIPIDTHVGIQASLMLGELLDNYFLSRPGSDKMSPEFVAETMACLMRNNKIFGNLQEFTKGLSKKPIATHPEILEIMKHKDIQRRFLTDKYIYTLMTSINFEDPSFEIRKVLIQSKLDTIVTTSPKVLSEAELYGIFTTWLNQSTNLLVPSKAKMRAENILILASFFKTIIKHYLELLDKKEGPLSSYINFINNNLIQDEFLEFSESLFVISSNSSGTNQAAAANKINIFLQNCTLEKFKLLMSSIGFAEGFINHNHYQGHINNKAVASVEFMEYFLDLEGITMERIQNIYRTVLNSSDAAIDNQLKVARKVLPEEKFKTLASYLLKESYGNVLLLNVIQRNLSGLKIDLS